MIYAYIMGIPRLVRPPPVKIAAYPDLPTTPPVCALQWLSPPVYPYATKQFYEMFEKDDSQYDGVYAMLVSC